VSIAHRDADLPDAPHPFLDRALVAEMKRLAASAEQGRRLLRIERRAQPSKRLFGPVLRRALRADAKIEALGWNEHAIGVLEAAGADAVQPNRERVAKGGARLLGWADEIGDHGATRLGDPVAYPSHAARVLDAIGVAEAEIARDVRAHCVGVEHDRVKERRECGRERGLARAG
jgi:hypothetical protein